MPEMCTAQVEPRRRRRLLGGAGAARGARGVLRRPLAPDQRLRPQWQLFFIPNHHSSMDETVGVVFENHAIFEENNFSLSCAISDWVVPGEGS